MIVTERTTGNAFTRDPDYENFLGRQYEGIIYDWTRRRWVRCKMQAPKTRKDFVQPNDPDLQMQPETLSDNNSARTKAAIEGMKKKKAERDAILLEQIIDCLTKNGPMSAPKIRNTLSVGDQSRVYFLLRDRDDIFVYWGNKYGTWSLIGQEYKPKKQKVISAQMAERIIAIQKILAESGPQTSSDLAQQLNKHPKDINRALIQNPKFVVVGMRPANGHIPVTKIWGLVETSEKENS